jgi:hypothetical protein
MALRALRCPPGYYRLYSLRLYLELLAFTEKGRKGNQ